MLDKIIELLENEIYIHNCIENNFEATILEIIKQEIENDKELQNRLLKHIYEHYSTQ